MIHVLVVGMCRVQVKVAERGVCVQVMKVGYILMEMGVRTVYVQVTKVGFVLIEMGVRMVRVQVMKVGFARVKRVDQKSMKGHRYGLLEVDQDCRHPWEYIRDI